MVYKRYINGRPYYYESRKENGKVVTKYLGTKLEKKKKVPAVYLILAVSFFALFAVFFLVSEFNFNLTGHTVLSNETSISENVSVDNNSVSGGSVIAENETSDFVENNSVESNETIEVEEVNNTEEVNETQIIIEGNEIIDEEENITEVLNEEENITEVLNETEEIVESVDITLKIDTTQYPVVVGMPVKWKKKITASNVTNSVSVKLPKEAENVVVYKIKNETLNGGEKISKESVNSFSITGNVVGGSGKGFGGIIDFFKNLFNKLVGAITGRVIDVQENEEEVEIIIEEENAAEYEIEYETPAPIAFEEQTENGKKIIISSDYHYENILAYSELPKETELNKIKLYSFDESTGEKILTEFDSYDSDGDLIVGETPEEKGFENISVENLVNVSNYEVNSNLVSFITWVVPHLSNQTYEIVIEISAAEYLDVNKVFIEDIYDEVSAQDNVWKLINSEEYVRVTFERYLTSSNDITIYARSSGIGNIGVYREDGNDLIAVIDGINEEGFYKTYLTGLNDSESYLTFDLKILNSGIEFDYIVDPFYLNSSAPDSSGNVTVEGNFSHLSLTDEDLVLYMPFDVADGNGTWVAGNNSGGLDFDGIDDQIVIPDSDLLIAPDGITISGWVKSTDSSAVLVRKRLPAEHSYQINVVTGNLWFTIDNGTGNIVKTTGSPTTDGDWHHFLGTWDGTNASVYVDGNYKVSATVLGSMSSTGQPLYLGGYDTLFLDGVLDEVRIFNRSVNSTEISELYNHNVINSTGLVGEWLLDDGESLVAEDSSGMRNHGDLTGYGADTRYVYDYSGNNLDGTIVNAIKYNSSGYFGGNYNFFNGIAGASPDYISLSDSDLLDIYENKTFSAWFYPNDFHVNARIFSKSNAVNGWEIFSTGGQFRFRTYNTSGNYESYSNSVASEGAWNHIVVVLENGIPSFYINGNNEDFVIRTDHPLLGSASVARLGTSFSSTGTYGINGRLDEVMIWNRSLSSSEIADIYNNQSSRFYNTGEVLFQGLDFSTNNTVNVTFDSCQTLKGSYLQGKINDGSYKNFSGCSFVDYELGSLSDLDNANFTVKLVSDGNLFYSPLVIGNITLNDYETDQTLPTITFKSPTPDNNAYTDDAVLIRANISDDSGENTSAWIDFDNDLIGYWGMDYYNSNGVFDNSSYSNFGDFRNGLGTENLTTGVFGNAFSFDGDDDQIELYEPLTSTLLAENNWTISLWVYSKDYSVDQCAFATVNTGISFCIGADNLGYFWGGIWDGSNYYRASTPITLNEWKHLVFTNSNKTIHFYVDNVEVSESFGAILGSGGTTRIGARRTSDGGWNGSIDEVMIFNRSLSQDEVSALYNAKVDEYFGNFTSLFSGSHDYTLYAIDTAGNLNTSSRTLNVDATAPSMVVRSPENNSYASSNLKFDVSVFDSDFGNTYTFINDSNLVGYWSFDSTNSTGVFDTSGSNNFGTFTGGIGENNLSDGQFGNALDFDGTDDYVNLGSHSSLENFTEKSVFFWFNAGGFTGTSRYIYYGGYWNSPSYGDQFLLHQSSNIFYYYLRNPSEIDTYAFAFTPNQWNQVGYVWNGTWVDYYLNGEKLAGGEPHSGTMGCNDSNVILGADRGAQNWYDGSLDEFLIFNRSLSQEEISSLYNSSAQKFNASYSLPSSGLNEVQLLSIDSGANQNSTTLHITNDEIAPVIEFELPTPNDGDSNGTFALINTTITEDTGSDSSAWIDWNKSLVGYWGMDYYNSTGVFDNSSYSNFGVFNGGLGSYNLTQAQRGKGLDFDGVDDYITLSSRIETESLPHWSISAWIKYYDCEDSVCAILGGRVFHVLSSTNQLRYYDGSSHFADTVISDGVWTHVSLTCDNSTGIGTFYINGIENGSESMDCDYDASPNRINYIGTYSGSDNFFNGSIDEVMIFNRALSSGEISALYNNTANRLFNNFTNLTKEQTYNYSVYAIDAAGNLNITSPDRQYTPDGTEPLVTIALPVAGNTYASSSVTFQTTTNENSTCEYSVNAGVTNNSMTANSAGTIHTATATLSNGAYTASYYCSDLYGNSNNTKNVSFTVSVSSGGTGSTGGTGGGTVTSAQTSPTISIDVNSVERTLALNRIELGQIGISNTGTSAKTFSVSVETINSLIEFENTTLIVNPGETGQFEYRLTPPKETGIYTGKIIIISTGFRKEIPITLNIKTETSLFDIIITIPRAMKAFSVGGNLEAQIDLLQMGIKEKMDVTLNYVIKDFSGKVYVVESETIAVTDQKTLQKEFHTEELPSGDYVLGTELIYPNGVAVASSQFKVKEKIPLGGGNFILYAAIGAFFVVFAIVFFIIRSYRRMLKKSK